jgi:hypothetical protein
MQIVAALFVDAMDLRQVPGPSTRIDVTGVQISAAAPGPFPCTVEPHLMVLLRNGEGEKPDGALEVTFHLISDKDGAGDGEEQVARNVQPVSVEAGKFAYRLVRAELTYPGPGTVEARVRVDLGDPVVVPYTLLPPVEG